MKKIAILGSTGSIGTQTLEVIRENKDIEVTGLAAGTNVDLLEKQIREFKPSIAAVWNEEKAAELGVKPLARFVSFATGGVPAEVMGVGPIEAVPKALRKTGLTLEQMDTIELNEAFASQALAVIRTLGMDPARVNPWGGAMALGHPLGATGAVLSCKAISELRRTGGKYAMVTMCIAGGMGAAGIFQTE